MIIKKLTLKIHKNGAKGRWKRGLVVLPAEVAEHFNWEEQELMMVFAGIDEKIDEEKLKICFELYKKIMDMDFEITKLKKEMEVGKIEELIMELKRDYTIVIVTHNMQQAARVSDYTGFFLLGELVEFGKTQDIFTAPKDKRTEAYITGRFG